MSTHMGYYRGLDTAEAERVIRSATLLPGWTAEHDRDEDGRLQVRLKNARQPRETWYMVGPGGYEEFLDAIGHKADCPCPACEQWWSDTTAEQNRRIFGEEAAK